MYHGIDRSLPYYTQVKHHKLVAEITVDKLLRWLGDVDMCAYAETFVSTAASWSRNYLYHCLNVGRSEEDKQYRVDEYFRRLKTNVISRQYESISVDMMEVILIKQ